ncbi:MAG: hypothetical protein ABWZ83_13120, partial [Mesorhizobium sp.]
MGDDYLIWSNEQGAWRGPRRWGYVWRIENAGRYSRDEALEICTPTVASGDAPERLREIPVRRVDVEFLLERAPEPVG